MKGYYITANINEREKGIHKKILTHINLLSGISEVEHLTVYSNSFVSKVLFRLPFFNSGSKYGALISQISNPDYLYIRKDIIDGKLIKFLHNIKNKYPNIIILYEIPTFPYENDILNLKKNHFILEKDLKFRKELHKYIDRIVTYSDDDKIFNVPTLKAHNGVECDSIKPISTFDLKDNIIRLLGVAQFRVQHGYERIIRGLGEYYKKNPDIKVYLTLVGNGPELQFYKDEVEKAKIDQYVTFAGSQMGKPLDELYEASDLAVSSLGMYKLGLEYVSTLKNCEYLAKGLPIIAGYDDYVLRDNPYSLRVPNDNSNLSINAIVDFYSTIYKNGKENVVNSVRKIALDKADIHNSYKEVLDYLLGTIK